MLIADIAGLRLTGRRDRLTEVSSDIDFENEEGTVAT